MEEKQRLNVNEWKQDLINVASEEKAKILSRFFKTGKGEYGEGDKFIGVTVPQIRAIAKKYDNAELSEVENMLGSPIHELRMSALLVLVEKYRKADIFAKNEIVRFYLENIKYINNWDLVDLSCPKILGLHTLSANEHILYELSQSANLWEKRIALVSTLGHIRKGRYDVTLKLCEKYISDKRDLIQKATGWMLREVGKKDESLLIEFLDKHANVMPRTALRYSLEKLHVEQRNKYMGR